VYRLARNAVKSAWLAILALVAVIFAWTGLHEILLLFGLGILGMCVQLLFLRKDSGPLIALPIWMLQATIILNDEKSVKLFWIFLKIGATLYGSGYVLFAFLDAELVSRHWLSTRQLTDAIAVGQFTPGPVFSSATFVGWQIAGWPGALLSTIAIFLPSFLLVGLLRPLIPHLRKSIWLSAFLDAVNVVALALIFHICIQMGTESIHDWRTVLIALLGMGTILKYPKLNTAWIILGGSLLGFLLAQI
jgi:chromate transporter